MICVTSSSPRLRQPTKDAQSEGPLPTERRTYLRVNTQAYLDEPLRHGQTEFVPGRFSKETSAFFVIKRKVKLQIVNITAGHVQGVIRNEDLQIVVDCRIVAWSKVRMRG